MKEALKLALEALEESCYPRMSSKHTHQYDKSITAIKEALTQDEQSSSQEPVAWTVAGDGKFGEIEIGQHAETDLDACRYWVSRGYSLVPLYTTPPKRPWVGLTDVEWMNIVNKDKAWFGQRPDEVATAVAKLVEAKLKEKNT